MADDNTLIVAGIKSYDLTALTLTRSQTKGMTQLLATYLAYRYNSRRGYAHPSQNTIANHLKRSDRAVRMLISDLSETGEWHIVSGRGGAASSGTTWSSSRYYPTLNWIQSVVNEVHAEGSDERLIRRIANSARVLEILPTGAAQQTDIQIVLPGDGAEHSTMEDDAFLESLGNVVSASEQSSFRSSRASDRQQARSEGQTLINEGYDLRATIRRAKERARVRPERFEGGYARWLWNFAYTMAVRDGVEYSVWGGNDDTWSTE